MPWCWKMYIQPDKFKFNTRYKWPILLRYYYLCPTFYLEIIKYCIKIALNKMHIYK